MSLSLDPDRLTCEPTSCGAQGLTLLERPRELACCMKLRVRRVLEGGTPSPGEVERARACAEFPCRSSGSNSARASAFCHSVFSVS